MISQLTGSLLHILYTFSCRAGWARLYDARLQ